MATYSDPQALGQAISDRLRTYLRDHQGQLLDLRRQFAYDRLLTRIFTKDPERWILKGATALLARLGPRARHSLDLDLSSESSNLNDAEQAFRSAAETRLDDYFRFATGPGKNLVQGGRARRVPVVAYLGATEFANFHVDIVIGHPLVGTPEIVPALVPIEVPGIPQATYRAYPLVDHIADKLCALIERHPRGNGVPEASTRYRDLADLVILAHTARVNAVELGMALTAEARRRDLQLPSSLSTPTGPGWVAGYSRVTRELSIIAEHDLTTAMNTVSNFLNPVLRGEASGNWSHETQAWSDSDPLRTDRPSPSQIRSSR